MRPQTRYFDWEHARKQMAKVHGPHKHSGYIATVEFEPIVDGAGQADWLMYYTPGPKALAEFRSFAKRGRAVVAPRRTAAASGIAARTSALRHRSRRSHSRRSRRRWWHAACRERRRPRSSTDTRPSSSRRSSTYSTGWWSGDDPRVAKSPSGWLVQSIAQDYALPHGFTTPAERQRQRETQAAEERHAAEERRRTDEEQLQTRRERALIQEYWTGLSPEQQASHDDTAVALADAEARELIEPGPLREVGMGILRDNHTRRLLQAAGGAAALAHIAGRRRATATPGLLAVHGPRRSVA